MSKPQVYIIRCGKCWQAYSEDAGHSCSARVAMRGRRRHEWREDVHVAHGKDAFRFVRCHTCSAIGEVLPDA